MAPARDAVQSAYTQKLVQFKARQLSRRTDLGPSDEEDIQQELMLHVLRALRSFDPIRGSLNTFIDRVVNNAARMILRRERRQKRGGTVRVQSLDAEVVTAREDDILRIQAVTKEDSVRRLGLPDDESQRRECQDEARRAISSLPTDLQRICAGLIDGTESSVARDLDISRRQIRKATESIRAHFRAAGMDCPHVRGHRRGKRHR